MGGFVAEQDGVKVKKSAGFFRGDSTNFYPNEASFEQDNVVSEYFVKGWMPPAPFITKETPIAAFGSCFAANISRYLHERGFNVLTKKENKAYVTAMGEGIVNTFAIRQQFEWAWLGKTPEVSLWHGYSAEAFGYDEEIRKETKDLFDRVDVFVITLGLSEVWYDEPSGEVFWRAIPLNLYDPTRHKFRVSTVAENLENLRVIYRLIREYRPDAAIVFTISPIPLQATFRDVSCLAANAVSKSVLRVAVDELYRELSPSDPKLFYFPSYEIVMYLFNNVWQVDRRHVQAPVLQFNMQIFERYFCESTLDDAALLKSFRTTRNNDLRIGNLASRNRRLERGEQRLAQRAEEARAQQAASRPKPKRRAPVPVPVAQKKRRGLLSRLLGMGK